MLDLPHRHLKDPDQLYFVDLLSSEVEELIELARNKGLFLSKGQPHQPFEQRSLKSGGREFAVQPARAAGWSSRQFSPRRAPGSLFFRVPHLEGSDVREGFFVEFFEGVTRYMNMRAGLLQLTASDGLQDIGIHHDSALGLSRVSLELSRLEGGAFALSGAGVSRHSLNWLGYDADWSEGRPLRGEEAAHELMTLHALIANFHQALKNSI